MERLSPEEAYVISPVFSGTRADEPPEELASLIAPAKAKVPGLLAAHEAVPLFHAYYLTSLRSLEDFRRAEATAQFIERLAGKTIPDFRLVHVGGLAIPDGYADETDPNEAKGLFERKMLQRSLAGFMDMGETETWGKIAEAMTLRLLHNRPVVIYTTSDWIYEMLRDVHPMKVVGTPWQGLGFHVVNDRRCGIQCLISELGNRPLRFEKKVAHGINEYCKECGSLLRMYRPLAEKH